ncbi:transcriptional regulator [Pectobacterium sp. B1J-3]|uniref:winged helix-turn-helix domain-containing protein n=1 Tax=Pectobacterium sp. B1J-3 TaxID=3385371 RepID=UPI00390587CA
MVYLINHLILFNEDDGTLAWHDRENEAVALSFPVSRLFCLLIENPGVTLSRDVLLKEALEKNGLCSSINNLNNYLSLLRKALREFDLAESIVTIPKSGLIFNVESIERCHKENEIEKQSEGMSEEENEEEKTQVILKENKPTERVSWGGRGYTIAKSMSKRGYVTCFFIFSMILLFVGVIVENGNRFPYRYLVNVSPSGKCDVFYLYKRVDEQMPENYENLCSENVLFFLSKKTSIPGVVDKKMEIVISCQTDGKGCVTYVDY